VVFCSLAPKIKQKKGRKVVETFEILFIICVEILIKSIFQLLGFEPQTFHDNILKNEVV
jgi:hypothetical protein